MKVKEYTNEELKTKFSETITKIKELKKEYGTTRIGDNTLVRNFMSAEYGINVGLMKSKFFNVFYLMLEKAYLNGRRHERRFHEQ